MECIHWNLEIWRLNIDSYDTNKQISAKILSLFSQCKIIECATRWQDKNDLFSSISSVVVCMPIEILRNSTFGSHNKLGNEMCNTVWMSPTVDHGADKSFINKCTRHNASKSFVCLFHAESKKKNKEYLCLSTDGRLPTIFAMEINTKSHSNISTVIENS